MRTAILPQIVSSVNHREGTSSSKANKDTMSWKKFQEVPDHLTKGRKIETNKQKQRQKEIDKTIEEKVGSNHCSNGNI